MYNRALGPVFAPALRVAVAGSKRVCTCLLLLVFDGGCSELAQGRNLGRTATDNGPKVAARAIYRGTPPNFFAIMFGMGGRWRLSWVMAIYRCEAKIVTRSDGHSAVAAAAYRTGQKIKDERTGRTHDYLGRQKGIIQSVILRPDNAPSWTSNTATLWNEVELSERRKDSQVCREFILALPKELSHKEQFEAAVGWAQKELVSAGMIVEVSLHHPKGSMNPHCHLLCTMRKIEGDKFSAKKSREWNEKDLLLHWRESWCEAENAALAKAGRDERVDHRSLKDQGIDRLPQPKVGKEATAMKRKGTLEDPVRFQVVREVQMMNEVLPMMRAIQRQGEVRQMGVGATWWERSITFMSRVRERARNAIKGTWQKLLQSRIRERDKNGPQPEL